MKLSDISNNTNDIIESIINLYSIFDSSILESKNGPWWPEEWATNAFADPKFNSWLENLGVMGEPGRAMAGGVGRAYAVGDTFIVKFTCDSKEASAAAVLKNHDSDHAAQVYDVKRVMTVDDPRTGFSGKRVSLFAIVMEKLNTGVGKKMRAAGNAVYSYLDNNPGFIENVDAVVKVVMAKYINKRDLNDPNMEAMVRQVVEALHDVQEKTGIISQDPHGGNMALKGRKPAFFDFGRSSTNYDHPKTNGARVTSL